MDTTVLKKAGLTESQAKGYLALIEHGSLSPAQLAAHTGETRTNAYAIADKLASLGLASKTEGNPAVYAPQNPSNLKKLLVSRQRELKTTNDELNGILPVLTSQFRLTSDQPGVMTVEGAEALKMVYDEIIRDKQEVLIFPSRDDRSDPETAALIDTQIARQRAAGIKTRSFVRQEAYDDVLPYADDLLEIKKLPQGVSFEAQIMIFDNTVVTTVYNKGLVSTVITSPETAATLRSVFNSLWSLCR